MKKLKYLLFLFIIFLTPSVFADTTYDMTSLITSPVNYSECGTGSYTGVELNGSTNCWNTGNRYQGTLSRIYFNLPAPTGTTFENDTSYRLSVYMATNDWRNRFGTVVVSPGSSYINNFVDSFTFVSMKQINITFTVPYSGSTTYQTLYVNIPATNTSTLITGDTNWNLSKVTLTKLTTGSGGGSTNPGGPSTSFDDTAIINNANENTQDVINNNNTNTQDIINNNNSNSQNIIDNQNENNEKILNGIDSVNQQLGSCYKNLLSFSDLFPAYNTYIQGKTFKQSESDTPSSPSAGKSIKLQLFDSSNNEIAAFVNSDILSVARFNFYFTNTSDVYKIVFGVNGSIRDTLVGFYTSNLNLEENSVYTLSFNILSAMQGNITFSNFSLVKGNYNSDVFIDYGKSLCTSKLDTIGGAISDIGQQAAQNAQDIINNQNSNTQQQIESQKVCKFYDKNNIVIDNKYLGSSGALYDNSTYGVTDYIIVNNSTISYISSGTGFVAYKCFYTFNKSLISCSSINNNQSGFIDIPSNSYFVRFSISKSYNFPQFEICRNGNQVLNDSVNDLNDTLNNSNVDSGVGSDFFDDFDDEDFGLSQIITIPLNTIQSLTSKSCVPLQVPIPFTNSNVSLPCMTEIYQSKFPSIYNLWKIVSFGIVAYLIAIDIFHIVKGFKDPESDKVEVLDL